MTHSGYDLSLAALNTYLSTSAGRDKVGKFFQYFFRGVAGVAQELLLNEAYKSNELIKEIYAKSRSLFVRLMEARRTVRWLTSIGTFLAIYKPATWNNEFLFRINQLGMLYWQVLDHVRWLMEVKVIDGDTKVMKRVSFHGFVLASFAGVVYYFMEAVKVQNKLYSQKGVLAAEEKKALELQLYNHKRQTFKFIMNCIYTLHISEIYISHEAICGFSGAISGLIDIADSYPLKKKTE